MSSRFDWERLRREVPLSVLLEEDRVPPRAISAGTHFDCPLHPGHDHATFYKKGNCVTCWPEQQHLSPVDYLMHARGLDRDEAARALSERFGIPIRAAEPSDGATGTAASTRESPSPAPAPPVEPSAAVRTWARLRDGVSKAGLAFLKARGFPAGYLDGLARRRFIASHARRAVHFTGDPPELHDYREALSFPLWRLTEPGDAEAFGNLERPTALWHRFLDPPEGKNGKPDKDRNQGPTGGCVASTFALDDLRRAARVFICEGLIKGLAVDVAVRGADQALEGLTAAQLEADLNRAKQRAKETGADGDDEASASPKVLNRRLRALRGRFGVWLALTGVGGLKRLEEIIHVLYGARQHRPAIRLALDADVAGERVARDVYRRLTAAGWECLIVRPTRRDRKDWDEVLELDGADAVRAGLECLHDGLILREGAECVSPVKFSHRRGWHLHATVIETDKEGGERAVIKPVADFTVRGAIRYQLFDFAGEPASRDVRQVIVCSREESDGRYGLDQLFFRPEAYNNPDRWSALGAVHQPGLLKHYLSDAKDALLDTRRVIPIVGLMRVPGERRERYMLIDGDLRRQIGHAYRSKVTSVYDASVRWTGTTWAGPLDQREAAHRGRKILAALGGMFRRPIGPLALYWSVGTLCKVALDCYPHLQFVARTQAGKSTLVRLLEQCLGLRKTGLKQWDTPYRRLAALGNHTLPVILDEASRLHPFARGELLNLLNEAFNPGSLVPYGQDQYPVYITASVLMLGQDEVTDPALETKLLSASFDRTEKVTGGLPNVAALPRWPWRAWGDFLCEHLARTKLGEAIAQHEAMLGSTLAHAPDRLRTCWAVLLAVRELVRAFLGLEDEDADGREFDALLGLAHAQAEQARETALESVEILHAYASIVASEPGQHPVLVIDAGDKARAGVWIIPNTVMHTVRRNGLHFAITSGRRFQEALAADGLLGAPEPENPEAHWIGGCFDAEGRPKRCNQTFRQRGGSMRQKAYLIPRAICERYRLDFPAIDTRADEGDDGPRASATSAPGPAARANWFTDDGGNP